MELLDELKEQIRQELDLCRQVETPYVCANLGTVHGRALIEKQVLTRVLDAKVSISEAITGLEQELNPNGEYGR